VFLLSIFPGSALGEELGWRGFALLITPLGKAMIQPFAIFTAMIISTAAVVVWLTGPANLSRTKPRQVA
jgi:membrane protease YdiL (CAAX protease family)